MQEKFNKNPINPLVQLVKNLLSKFIQTPDIYPIKYYKKGMRFRRFS
ncbi:MAG: hypothetical protein ABIN01_23795 [Ferruginibacter sp.]